MKASRKFIACWRLAEMNEAQQIVEDTIAKCVEDAYKLTPSNKTDAFINAIQAVKYPTDSLRAGEACNSLLSMLETIRNSGYYNYSHIHGAHVANVQREWFKIVDKYGLLRRAEAKSLFWELNRVSLGTSIAEYVSRHLDELVFPGAESIGKAKAQLHRVLIMAPDAVSKVDTNEAIKVLGWVMRLWVDIPCYIVDYHGYFQDVYRAYEEMLTADRNAKGNRKPSATQNADDIDDP